MEAALSQAERWHARRARRPVAVNLSPRSISPELPRDLAGILDGRTASLELEITETVGMLTPTARRRARELTRARHPALGRRLRHGLLVARVPQAAPVDELKIDRSFVMGMDHEASDRAIVHSTVDLARHLGLEVVAEGVESQEALAELRALGCHLAQGFAISPPLGADALAAWAEAARFFPPPKKI